MRQVVLDTETTGLEPERGHRIVEIGAVEIADRQLTGRRFHRYVNPERPIDDGAFEVHGLSLERLQQEPRFAEVALDLLDFVQGAELIIHNAEFDVAFVDLEFELLPGMDGIPTSIRDVCPVTDTLEMARRKFPAQHNTLDALCRRLGVDNSQRELHGALLDAEILADVYLLMTGGQTSLFDSDETRSAQSSVESFERLPADRPSLTVVRASPGELAAHEAMLDRVEAEAEGAVVWREATQPA